MLPTKLVQISYQEKRAQTCSLDGHMTNGQKPSADALYHSHWNINFRATTTTTTKHSVHRDVRMKLENNFGEDAILTGIRGKRNVVTSRSTAEKILERFLKSAKEKDGWGVGWGGGMKC